MQAHVNCATDHFCTLNDLGEEQYTATTPLKTKHRLDQQHTRQTARVWKSRHSHRSQVTASRLTPKKTLVMIALTANKRCESAFERQNHRREDLHGLCEIHWR